MPKKYRVTWTESLVDRMGQPHDVIQYSTTFPALHDGDPIESIPSQFMEEHKRTCSSGKTAVVLKVEGPLD